MKTIPLLFSLAAGVAAQRPEGGPGAAAETAGNIRATKLAGRTADKVKRRAAAATAKDAKDKKANRKGRSRHADQTPEARKQRRDLGDRFHRMMREGKERAKDPEQKKKKQQARDLKEKKNKRTVQLEMTPASSNTKKEEKGRELTAEERELKKAKSDKGGWGGSGDMWGSSGDHDDMWGSSGDSHDMWGSSGDRWGSGSWDNDDDWGWGGGSGKSGKGGWGGGGKSGKGWGGGSKGGKGGGGWGSGKSGKGGGGCDGDYAYVTVTNLSFEQSFSELFIMTATKDVTQRRPVFIFGNRTNDALAELAQDADATGMLHRYDHRHGVEMTKIFTDFNTGFDFQENFLHGGSRARFKVKTSGDGHRLTIAAGLPFTNDGAVVLEGAPIYEGAEYYLPAIDVGAEGNINTCWSVAAQQDDFPFRSECADNEDSDENVNEIPGENFVSMHRGIVGFGKDLEDLLFFPTCEDLDLDDCNNECFAEYFYLNDFDDDDLLCQGGPRGPSNCDLRDDDDFRDNAKDYDNNIYIKAAANSDSFEDFCDDIDDLNKDIEDALDTLEPWIFDWRNEMMHVEIDCGWHGDEWGSGDGGDGSFTGRFDHYWGSGH